MIDDSAQASARDGEVVVVDYDLLVGNADDFETAYRDARDGRYPVARLAEGLAEGLDVGGVLGRDWRNARELRAWTDPVSLLAPELLGRVATRLDLVGRLGEEEIGIIGGSAFPGITSQENLQRVGRTVKGMLCLTASVPMARIFLQHAFRGEFHYVSTACASGGHALLMARSLLLSQSDTKLFLVCCWDFPLIGVVLDGFRRSGTLFRYREADRAHNDPRRASRPFSRDRAGMVPAEAVAVMAVTTRATATRLGIGIRGVLSGAASSGGARSHVAPDERSVVSAIHRSLRGGRSDGTQACTPDLISAHANSTEVGDAAEARALASAFGENLTSIPLVSTQEFFGHTYGASVLVQAMFALEMMRRHELLAMWNHEPDPALPRLRIAREPEAQHIGRALVLGIGFGGASVAITLTADA